MNKKLVQEWLVEKFGGAEKGKKRLAATVAVVYGFGGMFVTLMTVLFPLIVAKFAWEMFVGPLSFTFTQIFVAYLGFRLLRAESTLSHAGNLAIKFAGLPFILYLAWAEVMPLFWAARPEMDFRQVWIGYVGIYALATVLSQVLKPKEVL